LIESWQPLGARQMPLSFVGFKCRAVDPYLFNVKD